MKNTLKEIANELRPTLIHENNLGTTLQLRKYSCKGINQNLAFV